MEYLTPEQRRDRRQRLADLGEQITELATHVHAGRDITDQTPVPDRDGVKPDYNAVIQSMLYREQGRKPPV